MFNLQVLPHRGKKIQNTLKLNLAYFIVNHYDLYSVIRENPYNKLKGTSRTNIIGNLETYITTQLREPFKLQTMDYVPTYRLRTIDEDLNFQTENMGCYALPCIDWEQQTARWRALLLLKITG